MSKMKNLEDAGGEEGGRLDGSEGEAEAEGEAGITTKKNLI